MLLRNTIIAASALLLINATPVLAEEGNKDIRQDTREIHQDKKDLR